MSYSAFARPLYRRIGLLSLSTVGEHDQKSYEDNACKYSFAVPFPPGKEMGKGGGTASTLELRGSDGSGLLGRSNRFSVKVSPQLKRVDHVLINCAGALRKDGIQMLPPPESSPYCKTFSWVIVHDTIYIYIIIYCLSQARTTFVFVAPNRDSVSVRGDIMDISWESTGDARDVWINLHDAETVRNVFVCGAEFA